MKVMNNNDFDGFLELNEELTKYMLVAENIAVEEEKIANEFVNDLKKLPKPRSMISKGGYTHLIDTFAKRTRAKEIEVGWGKYYGPMVENGTRKMGARSHLKPLWNKNVNKYITNFKNRTNF